MHLEVLHVPPAIGKTTKPKYIMERVLVADLLLSQACMLSIKMTFSPKNITEIVTYSRYYFVSNSFQRIPLIFQADTCCNVANDAIKILSLLFDIPHS